MAEYLTEIGMETLSCGCGITFAAPKKWVEERKRDRKTFYCPNGCHRYYPKENEEERLKRLLAQEQRCCISARNEANTLERSVRAYKGQITKLKKAKE